jgi:hypothetical protein
MYEFNFSLCPCIYAAIQLLNKNFINPAAGCSGAALINQLFLTIGSTEAHITFNGFQPFSFTYFTLPTRRCPVLTSYLRHPDITLSLIRCSSQLPFISQSQGRCACPDWFFIFIQTRKSNIDNRIWLNR